MGRLPKGRRWSGAISSCVPQTWRKPSRCPRAVRSSSTAAALKCARSSRSCCKTAMTDTAGVNQLVDHFFRHESGKLVSLLTRLFGLHHLDLVEDVVQSAMLQALETWTLQGVPRDPAGWMYRVARNNALDLVRRRNVAARLAAEVGRYQAGSLDRPHAFEHLCLDREIQDSQLRMMFACCHPALPAESQMALTLKILGGLSTLEIARALLTTEGHIKKRLARAKRNSPHRGYGSKCRPAGC